MGPLACSQFWNKKLRLGKVQGLELWLLEWSRRFWNKHTEASQSPASKWKYPEAKGRKDVSPEAVFMKIHDAYIFSLSLISPYLRTFYQVACKVHFHTLSHLIVNAILWGMNHDLHHTEEKTENQDIERLNNWSQDKATWVVSVGVRIRTQVLLFARYCSYALTYREIISLLPWNNLPLTTLLVPKFSHQFPGMMTSTLSPSWLRPGPTSCWGQRVKNSGHSLVKCWSKPARIPCTQADRAWGFWTSHHHAPGLLYLGQTPSRDFEKKINAK